jgi:hypothetical protein
MNSQSEFEVLLAMLAGCGMGDLIPSMRRLRASIEARDAKIEALQARIATMEPDAALGASFRAAGIIAESRREGSTGTRRNQRHGNRGGVSMTEKERDSIGKKLVALKRNVKKAAFGDFDKRREAAMIRTIYHLNEAILAMQGLSWEKEAK